MKMRGVDLARFQFDFDLTWAAVILRADGMVLGRYGVGARDPMRYNSLEGLRLALQRSLALHRATDTTAAVLAGKMPPELEWRHPEDLPYQPIAQTTDAVKGCIHCHNVHEALQEVGRKEGRFATRDFAEWYPPPESLGLVLDRDDGLHILEVKAGSPAAQAGLRAGDVLRSASGQPLVSTADLVWNLHQSPPGATRIDLDFERDAVVSTLTLALEAGWKVHDAAWRASMFALPPRPGLWVEEIDDSRRPRLGLAPDTLAVEVLGLFEAAVKKSGLKKGDIIIEADGRRERRDERAFHFDLRMRHEEPGSIMKLKVRRGDETKDIQVRF
ncbi:MAG: PDZ domain-containing protein [Planctomycetes bacterium]|nr:PDZ domain-containing protein [Planctomycetota bacterium]